MFVSSSAILASISPSSFSCQGVMRFFPTGLRGAAAGLATISAARSASRSRASSSKSPLMSP
jgi:hypothetical protein